MKFKVMLNWSGELHTFFTNASSESRALGNAITRLAKALGVSRSYVKPFFDGRKDNFKVERGVN